MRYCFLLITGLGFCLSSFAQQAVDTVTVDNKYREDQFYLGVSYNLLGGKPSGVSQSGFSNGFQLGFIRDMPINKRRNLAFALGLGASINTYHQNLVITESDTRGYDYTVIDDNDTPFSKNRFSTYVLEVPFEVRWRTSTATDYKFWRIYTGLKLGYVFSNSTKFTSDTFSNKLTNVDDFNDLQLGLTLNAGYGTWNVSLYYGLNPIFKDTAIVNGNIIDMNNIRIGLIFYIL